MSQVSSPRPLGTRANQSIPKRMPRRSWKLDPGVFGVVTFGFKHKLKKQLDVSQVKYIVARSVLQGEKRQNTATLFDYKAKTKRAVILVVLPDGEKDDAKQVVNLSVTDSRRRRMQH